MTLHIDGIRGQFYRQGQEDFPKANRRRDDQVPLTSLEKFLLQFPKEMTRFSSLAGMAAGGLAFRVARYGALAWAERAGWNLLATGLSGRLASATAGTLVEAPVFNGVAHVVAGLTEKNPRSQPMDPWWELAATATMLSSLRSFGLAAQKVLSLGKLAEISGAALWVPAIFQMGGLHFSHYAQKKLGLIDPRLSDPGVADHLATVMQFAGMGLMVRNLLGPRWAALEHKLDKQIEWRMAKPSVDFGIYPELAWAEGRGAPEIGTVQMQKAPAPSIWKIISSKFFDSPAEPMVTNGPGVITPHKVFPWTHLREIEGLKSSVYVEFGSRSDFRSTPGGADQIAGWMEQVRSLFSIFPKNVSKNFSGLLAKILTQYPGLFWGIKTGLSQPGYKAWVQIDADKGELWNTLLLDGFDRPRQSLLMMPYGMEAVEMKVDFHPTGLPQIQGTYFISDARQGGKVSALPIQRVRYDGIWEEKLYHPATQQHLFEKRSFPIELYHQRKMPLAVQYTFGDRRAHWQWNVLPFYGPMLGLETRYEEYRPPTVKALMEAGVLKKPKKERKQRPAAKPQPEKSPPVAQKEKKAAPARTMTISETRNSVVSLQSGVLYHLKNIEGVEDTNPRKRRKYFKALYYDLLHSEKLAQVHPLILQAIPNFLQIPYYGPSFVTHYGRMASPESRIEVLLNVHPLLSDPNPHKATGAFEVIRHLSPFIREEDRVLLMEEMRHLHGQSQSRQWRRPTSMVYQGYRALSEPSQTKEIYRPTFL